MEPIYKESDVIGRYISTKKIGSNYRDDNTYDYKYEEGTFREAIPFRRSRVLGGLTVPPEEVATPVTQASDSYSSRL